MKKLLLCIMIISSVKINAQIFSGKIVYDINYQSKLPNLKSEQLNLTMGTKQYYYIKGNTYKSIFNGTFIKMQLYKALENNSYTLTGKNDTLYFENYGFNKDIPITYELQKNKDTIIGIVCDLMIVETNKSKTHFYFSSKFGINPDLFKGHTYGNWYNIISKTKSLPLKTV